MPELPEVETVVQGIKPHIEARTITKVRVINPKLRFPVPKAFTKQSKATVLKVKRKAKYIILELDNDYSIVIHLGMSGKLNILEKKQPQAKHDHVLLDFDSGKQLLYNDTRKFGLVSIIPTLELPQHKLFAKLGVEPLDSKLNAEVFYNLIHSRNKSIKSVIMDANIIVGVGNIYACEALFSAGIHPEKLASKISKAKAALLYQSIRQTLEAAIKAGGSTISDYAKADGSSGYFQHNFKVYDREGETCLACSNKIKRIKQNGRSSYYCSKCQR